MMMAWISLRVSQCGLTTLLALFITCGSGMAYNGPAQLPATVVVPAHQVVMLDFYAKWCGWCQRMAPTIKKLSAQHKGQLKVIHIDVDDPKNATLVDQYHVDSVPTYHLYGDKRQRLFSMDDYLDAKVLSTSVDRFTGTLKPQPPPGVSLTPGWLHWVLLNPTAAQRDFASQQAGKWPKALKVHPLSSAQAKGWPLAQAQQGAGYVLLDDQGRVLLKAPAAASLAILDQYLTLFLAGEP
jgi:thiol-disulfide isomerase/thioredoxin